MGCKMRERDSVFGHELIEKSPSLQITNHAFFGNRQIADDRLNPAGSGQKLAFTPFRKALVRHKGLGLGRINRACTTPFCAFFDPSSGLLNGNPVERAVAPLVKTRHLWKVWNEVNTKANQIRANWIILQKTLFLYRTEGSNPSLSEYLTANDLGRQVQSEVDLNLIPHGGSCE